MRISSIPRCSECGGRAFIVHQDIHEPYYFQIECWERGDKIVVGKTLEEALEKWKRKE